MWYLHCVEDSTLHLPSSCLPIKVKTSQGDDFAHVPSETGGKKPTKRRGVALCGLNWAHHAHTTADVEVCGWGIYDKLLSARRRRARKGNNN
ncbi:unnamed protein product [Leptosia nina]|uniref:Uncharacterized protein n=1 Tax=Leptosia nina TaxID=320188 RepID=A0AAV1K0A0_9NEOP